MEIDAVVDELYGLPPEEFTAARDAAAKATPDPRIRKALKGLRRPTAAAHAVNLLVRRRSEDVDRLLALGADLRAVMGGDPAEVRRLTAERRRVIAALVDGGLPAGVQQDVTATLEAATADPTLAAAVRGGRLVKPLRYAGFGELPDLEDAVATPPSTPPPAKGTRRRSPAGGQVGGAARSRTGPRRGDTPEDVDGGAQPPAGPSAAELSAARAQVLDLAGRADDAQRRFELADRRAAEARELLELAAAERAEALAAAEAAHAAAEQARQELGRLERS